MTFSCILSVLSSDQQQSPGGSVADSEAGFFRGGSIARAEEERAVAKQPEGQVDLLHLQEDTRFRVFPLERHISE